MTRPPSRARRRLLLPGPVVTATALGILLAVAGPARAAVDYELGASLRLRGIWLRNGTFVRQLAAPLRQQLDATGDTQVDEQQTFIDMRLRAFLRVSPIEAARLNAAIEVGDLTFGDIAVDGSASKNGGAIGTDGVITESKHLNLEVDLPQVPVTLRGGLFAFDTPKGLILSDDVAGLQARLRLEGARTSIRGTWIKAVESSRRDLDGDGRIDNDFHDEDILIAEVESSIIPGTLFGAYFIADLDNSGAEPTNRLIRFDEDQYWVGLNFNGRFGRVSVELDGIYNFGWLRRRDGSTGNVDRIQTSAWAGDARVTIDLTYLQISVFAAAATGNDPQDLDEDDSFHTISPFYAPTNILYGGFGGLDVFQSQLSGTMWFGGSIETGLTDKLSAEALVAFARLTERPAISDNVFVGSVSRSIGWEVDVNLDYKLYEPLTVFWKSGVLFPMRGMEAFFDSPDDDPVFELIIGAQLDV